MDPDGRGGLTMTGTGGAVGRFRILVVDDDPQSRALLARILAARGHRVEPLADGKDALAALQAGAVDLVVSDIRMAEVDGYALAEKMRATWPDTPVILVTAFGNVEGAVEAIRRGAFDYISKPYDVDAIAVVVERALRQRALVLENRSLRREVREKYRLENVVGRSERMLDVYKTAARVAPSSATVLILGESGTGKELVARAIHAASGRAAGPFVPVDCGAIAEGVLESELFGHVRGAFTGAQAARRGLFEEAHGGTLFLDEIGDIGPALQARLLRALQEGEIRPVGSNEVVPVDVRVVAATNKDLAAAVKDGRFREDLFYRLNVVTIRIPPLRDRREDVPLLAEHFAAKLGRAEAAVTQPVRELLVGYDWPGNVRELENVIARALALNPSGVIVPEDLPEAIRRAVPPPLPAVAAGERPTLSELERRYAAQVLAEQSGNKTRAAEVLGIDRKTLYRILGERDEERAGSGA
jgi:two-component system, NtrC family, response regulator AtoC